MGQISPSAPEEGPEADPRPGSPTDGSGVRKVRPPDPGRPPRPKKKRPKRRKRRRSVVGRLLRGLFALLVVALGVLIALTQTDWGRERMAELATQAIRDQLGLEARFERVALRFHSVPFGMTIEALGIELDHPTEGELARARVLRVRPSLLALLRGDVDLQTIELDAPRLTLRFADGTLINGPTLPRTAGGGEIQIPFNRLVIRDASASIESHGDVDGALVRLLQARLSGVDVEADADDVSLDVRLGLQPREGEPNELELPAPAGTLRVETLRFEGHVDLATRIADIRAFELATRFAPLEGAEGAEGADGEPGVAFVLRDATIPFDLVEEDAPWRGHVRAEVDLPFAHRLPLGFELPALEGHVSLDAELAGEGLTIPGGEGKLRVDGARIENKWRIGDFVDLDFELDGGVVTLREGSMAQLYLEGGEVQLTGTIGLDLDAGLPVSVDADVQGFQFAKFMALAGVTEDSIVWWLLNAQLELRGTLLPLALDGPVRVRSQTFSALDRAWHDRDRRPLFSVGPARIHGRLRFDENAAHFYDLALDTGRTKARVPMVRLGYAGGVLVEAFADRIDAADVSPLVGFDLQGIGSATARVQGDFDNPSVRGTATLRDARFDGFRLGDITTDWQVRDDYWAVLMPNVEAVKGTSRYRVDDLVLDFSNSGAAVTGHLRTGWLTLADVYHALRLEGDERYEGIQGVTRGHMSLDFTWNHPGDGPNGTFRSDMVFDVLQLDVDGFVMDQGHFRGSLLSRDLGVGLDASVLQIDELVLKKGRGTLLVAGEIRAPMEESPQGPRLLGPAQVQLMVAADDISFDDTEMLRESMPDLHGSFSLLGDIRGTPDIPRGHFDIGLTGVRIGDTELGDGRTYVRLTDVDDPWVRAAEAWSADDIPEGEPCAHGRYGLAHGRWRPSPPVRTADGPRERLSRRMAYVICGEAMRGQVSLDLALGWTTAYPMRGVIALHDLDLTPFLASYAPDQQVSGRTTGQLAINAGGLRDLDQLGGWLRLEQLRVEAADPLGGGQVRLRNDGAVQISLERGGFAVQRARLDGGAGTFVQLQGRGDAQGRLALRVDGSLDLAALQTLSTQVARSSGQATFRVDINGTAADPILRGEASLLGEELALSDPPVELRDLRGRVTFDGRRAVFDGFEARVGSGRALMAGEATMRDGALRAFFFDVGLRNARLRPADGIDVTLGGDTRLSWRQGQPLPRLEGEVRIERARYERPIQLSPTLGQLYRPQRAEVERYDPAGDVVELDLRIVDRSPIRIINNLIDVDLRIDDSERPMRLVGTNQRYGLLGSLSIPRGIVRFRNTELAVSQGDIRFQDETRIDASFDIVAQTEIRRQQTSVDLTAPAWRVSVRAHGDLDAFQLDATSEPSLSREDLMLLLTVGMTSIEAQQLQAGDVGGTALEALSALTGVNEEVTSAVRVIDEFAITTMYSPQTGRPEPMVTIGKRITERIRLSAATGLSGEERSFRTALEWRMGDSTSVQMLYDNLNRETASSFGNLGVDFHWRLEFE
ncbi:MAG: translocation/assembly module TamB domain-containing protein [Myxococcales bacterium]|nr:translocation/assembly module TamB domain-containing protein [Myxococcales bacterium]